MLQKPKGKLLIIGGHEEKGISGEGLDILKKENVGTHFAILHELIAKVPKNDHRIEIIATASSMPKATDEMYIAAIKNAGFGNTEILKLENEEQTNSWEAIKRVRKAHAVFFTGGDQKKLCSILKGTKILKAIKNKYLTDENFIVAGTSAGAMSIPEIVITGGIIEEALLKGDLDTGTGLDFIGKIIIDTHFIKRGRFARLAHAITINPTCLGIGLGEDSALIISNGNEAECRGSGMTILIDGTGIKATNVNYADKFTPVVVENLKINIMASGCKYLIKEKKFIIGKNLIRSKK